MSNLSLFLHGKSKFENFDKLFRVFVNPRVEDVWRGVAYSDRRSMKYRTYFDRFATRFIDGGYINGVFDVIDVDVCTPCCNWGRTFFKCIAFNP